MGLGEVRYCFTSISNVWRNQAGFVKPCQGGGPSPYDFCDYNGNEWPLGGQLTNESTVLAPQEVYKQGTCLIEPVKLPS
jgi:hypothetical protein